MPRNGTPSVEEPDELLDQADPGTPDPVAEAEKRRYIGVPRSTEDMFHGRIGAWTAVATSHSEASGVAVYLNFVAYVGVCQGRDPHLWIADDVHHPRINILQVGRTARAREGTAMGPIRRLHDALAEVDDVAAHVAESSGGHLPERLSPQVHAGGLSTREGIAWAIRDPVMKWNATLREWETEDEGVKDKRMLAVESEFANVLHQSGREGNTLSPAIRDLFDGKTLAPLTKTNRTTASNPHVALAANVTPGELLELLKETARSPTAS